jgi:hypothetical protein
MVILLTFLTLLLVLAGAVYDRRQTVRPIRVRRHSTRTTAGARPRRRL